MVNGAISYGDIVHPDDRQRVHDEISAALRDQRRFFVEYRIRCRDGALKWVWARGVGIFMVPANIGGGGALMGGHEETKAPANGFWRFRCQDIPVHDRAPILLPRRLEVAL
mgnify:CR=1 FL=1